MNFTTNFHVFGQCILWIFRHFETQILLKFHNFKSDIGKNVLTIKNDDQKASWFGRAQWGSSGLTPMSPLRTIRIHVQCTPHNVTIVVLESFWIYHTFHRNSQVKNKFDFHSFDVCVCVLYKMLYERYNSFLHEILDAFSLSLWAFIFCSIHILYIPYE